MDKHIKAKTLAEALYRILDIWPCGLEVPFLNQAFPSSVIEMSLVLWIAVKYYTEGARECYVDVFWWQSMGQGLAVLVEVLLVPVNCDLRCFAFGNRRWHREKSKGVPIETRAYEIQKNCFYFALRCHDEIEHYDETVVKVSS